MTTNEQHYKKERKKLFIPVNTCFTLSNWDLRVSKLHACIKIIFS